MATTSTFKEFAKDLFENISTGYNYMTHVQASGKTLTCTANYTVKEYYTNHDLYSEIINNVKNLLSRNGRHRSFYQREFLDLPVVFDNYIMTDMSLKDPKIKVISGDYSQDQELELRADVINEAYVLDETTGEDYYLSCKLIIKGNTSSYYRMKDFDPTVKHEVKINYTLVYTLNPY